MGPRATTLALSWAVCCLAGTALLAQPPAGAPDTRSPAQIFRAAKDLIAEGRFDVAGEELKKFLAANPVERDYLDIQAKDAAAFQKLRKVPVWSDEPKAQAEYVRVVGEIIAKAEEANRKVHRDPARIAKFTRNLGESLEERLYAEQQLVLAGDAAVPVMLDQLRTASDVNLRAGILGALSKLGTDAIPGFLAAADGLPDDLKLGIVRSLAGRPDVLKLLSAAETDFVPHLWYYSSSKFAGSKPLNDFAVAALERLAGPGASRRNPEAALVAIADTFAKKTARFAAPDRVRLWAWDAGKLNVTSVEATKAQAEEVYAVKYLQWALDIKPTDTAAQELFITTTVERAVERGRFADLPETDPRLTQVLAAAPSDMLVGLLEQALIAQRTALALGLTQALAVRADKAAAVGPAPGKPGVLAKAIEYPDPRVQFAAAVGLLKVPVGTAHGKASRVVEVLRQALAAEPVAGKEAGRALIADPSDARADRLATLVRQAGYAVERFPTGRGLLRRIARSADHDLILIDRHVGDPVLGDLLSQLRADRRPVLVVASADSLKPVPVEHLLLRLALLIAATDTPTTSVPSPFAYDPRTGTNTPPVSDGLKDRIRRELGRDPTERELVALLRDGTLTSVFDPRLERMRRLVTGVDLPFDRQTKETLELRTEQLTAAVMLPEFSVTAESAPQFHKRVPLASALLRTRPAILPGADHSRTETLTRLLEQFEAALTPDQQKKYAQLLLKVDRGPLVLPADVARDARVEEDLARGVRGFKGVTVIAEPLTPVGFADELRSAAGDPAQLPRDPAEKRRAAKTAVEYLKRMAVGDLPGYDVRPAEAALRQALRDDELAADAADAVVRLSSAEAQQDLVFLALSATKPLPIRLRAVDRAIQHVQTFGKLTPANQTTALGQAAPAEPSNELKAKLLILHQLLAGKAETLSGLITKYPLPIPQPPPPGEPKAGDPPKN